MLDESPVPLPRRAFLACAIGAVSGCLTNSTTCDEASVVYDDRDWPMLRHDFHNTARVPSGTIDVSEPLELKWSYELPEGYYPPVSIRGDTVFASSGSALHAIDRESGEQRWRFDQRSNGPTVIDGGMSVTEENVFVTEKALPEGVIGRIYALNAENGAVEWEFVENGLPMAALVHSQGVFTRIAEDGLITLDINSGTRCDLNEGVFSDVLQSDPLENTFGYPAIDGQEIFTAWSDGDRSGIRRYNISNQEIIWDSLTDGEPLSVPVLLTPSSVFVGIRERNHYSLLALNRADGSIRWKFSLDIKLLTPMAIANGVLCVCGRKLYALDVQTGAVIWTFDDVGGLPPIAAGDTFVETSGGDSIYAIDAKTGNSRTLVEGPHAFEARPVVANGTLAVMVDSGDGGTVQLYQ